MGRDDEPHLAWLALWARRQDDDEPPAGGHTASLLSLATIYAAAGQLQHYQERAANDQVTANLLALVVLCAITCAKLQLLHTVSRKLCQRGFHPAQHAETRATQGLAALALAWLDCAKTITPPHFANLQELKMTHLHTPPPLHSRSAAARAPPPPQRTGGLRP